MGVLDVAGPRMGVLRVLLVQLEPAEGPATTQLRRLVAGLERRAETEVVVWFLREDLVARWPSARVVDDLRTWWANAALNGVGLAPIASWLRGRRLRRWFADADPDVIVLHDGWGMRIVSAAGPRAVVAVTRSPWPHEDHIEQRDHLGGSILIAERDQDAGSRRWVELSPYLREPGTPLTADQVGRARRRLGVPVDVPLVVGWGDDGWVDGADLFVRTLWYLRDRHGIDAHGLWLGPMDDATAVGRLTDEADRCGLVGLVHLDPGLEPDDRWCGDVVYLPRRVPLELELVASIAARDLQLVTSGDLPFAAAWVTSTPVLDLPAAAAALADALRSGRGEWSRLVAVDGAVDRLVAAVDEVRSR